MEQSSKKKSNQDIDDNPVITSLLILCPCNQIAVNVCSTEDCENIAFMCLNEKCTQIHSNCVSKSKLSQLTANIQKNKRQVSTNIKMIFEDVTDQYDNMIEKLSEDRLQFVEYTNFFGLSQKTIEAVKFINQGSFQRIYGKDINQVCEQMKEQGKIHSPQKMISIQYIKNCQSEINSLLKKLDYQINELADQKIKSVLQKFGQRDLNIQSLKRQNIYWEFIPIQIANFTRLKKLSLRKNLIRRIKNLQRLNQLQQLDLDHNQIIKIENLKNLTKLTQLCLTRNEIANIENLDSLVNLTNLYINSNKITKIQNLDSLTKLFHLDLRDNKITKIQNLDNLVNIVQLLLDQNKIGKVENLFNLPKLNLLSLRLNPMEPNQENIAVLKELKRRGLDSLYLPQ